MSSLDDFVLLLFAFGVLACLFGLAELAMRGIERLLRRWLEDDE